MIFNQLAVGGGGQSTWYGTSNTAAGTAEKAVTCPGFELAPGAVLAVLFLTASTAASPTLNVNGTGANTIFVGGNIASATTNTLKWSAYTLLTFIYDGTNWRYISAQAAASVQHPDGAGAWYGTSSTAQGTRAKASTIANYRLTKGAIVCVQFTNANTYVSNSVTLNINSTGAKSLWANGAVTSSTNTLLWAASTTLVCMYDGSYYRVLAMFPYIDTGWKNVTTGGEIKARIVGSVMQVIATGYTIDTTSGWVTVGTLPASVTQTMRFVGYDVTRGVAIRCEISGNSLKIQQPGAAEMVEFTVAVLIA